MRKGDQTHVTLPAKLCELAPLNRSGVSLDRKKMEDRTSLPSDYLPLRDCSVCVARGARSRGPRGSILPILRLPRLGVESRQRCPSRQGDAR